MDIFDQYLLDELISEYGRPGLTSDDYEELYIRFCNIEHLTEAKPYLFTMRFWGLGTQAEPDLVLHEIKDIKANNIELTGLYYDLLLCNNPSNTGAIAELRRAIDAGYTGRALKDKSNVFVIPQIAKEENTKLPKKEQTKASPIIKQPKTVPVNEQPENVAEPDDDITLTKEIACSLLGNVKKEEHGTKVLALPSSYYKIGTCAFQGIKEIDMLVIPKGYVEIEGNAFSWAVIHQVKIPESVIVISKNAFKGFTGVIECSADSYAYKYAKKYNIRTLVR